MNVLRRFVSMFLGLAFSALLVGPAAGAEKPAHRWLYLQTNLQVAENVAKVTYNSSGCLPPFDHDSGWWIAQNLKYIMEQINVPEFAADAWSALSDEKFWRI